MKKYLGKWQLVKYLLENSKRYHNNMGENGNTLFYNEKISKIYSFGIRLHG